MEAEPTEYIEYFIAALLALLAIIAILRQKLINEKRVSRELEHRLVGNSDGDVAYFVRVFARELSNELIQRDRKQFEENFRSLLVKWSGLKQTKQERLALFDFITAKYPGIQDFDLQRDATWTHFLSVDFLSQFSYQHLWDTYENLRLYSAIRISDPFKGEGRYWVGIDIELEELDAVSEYCKQLNDTEILHHLHRARDIYLENKSEDEYETGYKPWEIVTAQYTIKYLERELGPLGSLYKFSVYVKSLNQYGAWTEDHYSYDEQDESVYRRNKTIQFFASNESFTHSTPLEELECPISFNRQQLESYVNEKFEYNTKQLSE